MIPNDRRYTESHEWAKIEGNEVVVGLADYAQESLGDITFVELPDVGKQVKKGKECCVVESVKAASDVYSPVGGTVSAVNNVLENEPEQINKSCYEAGWIYKISNFTTAEFNSLMDSQSYQKFMEEHK